VMLGEEGDGSFWRAAGVGEWVHVGDCGAG
jgi:hypothetical protein